MRSQIINAGPVRDYARGRIDQMMISICAVSLALNVYRTWSPSLASALSFTRMRQPTSVSGIRYRRGPPMVRNMRAVLKKASWGTRRIFRSVRYKKTGFYGTEEIFGAKNSLLWYATHLQRPAEQPTPQTVDSLLPHRTHLQCAKRPRSEVISLKRG